MSGIDLFVGSGTGFCDMNSSNACACGCTVILSHLTSVCHQFDLLLMVLAGPSAVLKVSAITGTSRDSVTICAGYTEQRQSSAQASEQCRCEKEYQKSTVE